MPDTKGLEELNKEIVRLVDELSGMQQKQERLRDLMRQRSELEQQLLGAAAEAAPRTAGRRRSNGPEPVEPAASAPAR